MKSISVKLHEPILKETEKILDHLKISRNKYINDAMEFYNKYQKRKRIEEQLTKESKLVAADSMNVVKEFEALGECN
ncbi:hypothetical protein G3O08_03885 [Cryomorpha ignava]|uniref:CopG family transcriptional regulator n=1 Tax=Cryomorpha ignava TaxID=101383 RepID=A0A7K3WPG0_9FLAO|nr:hypothetical protein [Cryomorpha ignava]NEN22645.1 hypothetical protein [Cryomorpha ignava]